jgi:transcriptional regulator of arginine metabolism
MSKRFRQGQILNIIRDKSVFTQEEIAAELKVRGVAATQVTLSRDLRDLGLVKTQTGYREMAPEEPGVDLANVAREFVTDIRCAQNLLVLRTDPGHASPVALALDQEAWPELVGTIAGDDTILIIATDSEAATALRAKLLQLME